MSEESALPSIADVAAKFASANAAPVHERPSEDSNSGRGGTTSDPNNVEYGKPTEAPVDAAPEAETPAEVAKPVEKRDPAGSRFAALARKMKDALARETAVSEKQKAIEAREQALADRESRLQSAKRRPLDLLKEHGFKYDDALQDFMGGYKPAEPDPLDQRLEPLRQKWDKLEPNMEALQNEVKQLKTELTMKAQQESYEQAMGEIRTVAANTEKYELIGAMGDDAIDLVRDTVVEYFNRHQKLLDYSEACDIVEKYYEDEYVSRLLKTKKVQSRVQPATSKQAAPKEAKPSKPTLTQGQQTAPQATVNIDELSRADAIAYLSKKLQFTKD